MEELKSTHGSTVLASRVLAALDGLLVLEKAKNATEELEHYKVRLGGKPGDLQVDWLDADLGTFSLPGHTCFAVNCSVELVGANKQRLIGLLVLKQSYNRWTNLGSKLGALGSMGDGSQG